jgi:hypothetical protein
LWTAAGYCASTFVERFPGANTLRVIQNVPQSSSVDWGQSIQLELEFSDGQVEKFSVPFERIPRLAHAIHQAAMLAQEQRKSYPAEFRSTVVAYIVTNCEVFSDDQKIGIEFRTENGFPVQVAMSKEAAQNLSEHIVQRLSQPGTRAPRKPS